MTLFSLETLLQLAKIVAVLLIVRAFSLFWSEGGSLDGATSREKIRSFFRPFWKGWMRLAHSLEWMNTRILLGIIFYILLGVYAGIFRLVRLFRREGGSSPTSYWIPRSDEPPTEESVQRAF